VLSLPARSGVRQRGRRSRLALARISKACSSAWRNLPQSRLWTSRISYACTGSRCNSPFLPEPSQLIDRPPCSSHSRHDDLIPSIPLSPKCITKIHPGIADLLLSVDTVTWSAMIELRQRCGGLRAPGFGRLCHVGGGHGLFGITL